PTNIAGWGPREGVAAWVFALAGLGATQGVATTVVYGAMVFVATLPGAVLLLGGSLRRADPDSSSGTVGHVDDREASEPLAPDEPARSVRR
ncbi:MAG: hypothetical protein ACJ72A_11755, partial [Nocardioidaceae bacterium]